MATAVHPALSTNEDLMRFQLHTASLKDWFFRAGLHNRRRFMISLVQRLQKEDVLKYVVHVLNCVLSKDYTYTRSRSKPSSAYEETAEWSDHALTQDTIDAKTRDVLDWFQCLSPAGKSTFLFSLLKLCDVQLLHAVAQVAKTMLATEWAVKREEYSPGAPTMTFTDPIGYTKVLQSSDLDFNQPVTKSSKYSPLPDSRPKSNLSTSTSVISAHPATIYSQVVQNLTDFQTDTASIAGSKSVYSTFMIHPDSEKAHSGAWDTRDFVRELPIHLAKYILSMLDKKSLKACENVSRFWRLATRQVRGEMDVNQKVKDDSLMMQGGAAEGINPNYANDIDVPVPVIDVHTQHVQTVDFLTTFPTNNTPFFQEPYYGQQTRNVVMEERNIFCGNYNVLIVIDKEDDSRVIHTDTGQHLAVATEDRKIRLHDRITGQEVGAPIHGHVGTIRCLHIDHKQGYILSGSYDTTIRHWNIETGECERIYKGHQGTICSIKIHNNLMASGSRDKTCKVWDLTTGELLRTFKHHNAVSAVAIGVDKCITGDEQGVVKVWALETGKLIKILRRHTGMVTAISHDAWHIVTAARDSYAYVWSACGKHNRCLTDLRHQRAVLCAEMLYLRVVTGSEDGRIRIWNALTGHCCRIMRGNSRSDPVLSLIVIGNRITLNTRVSVITLNFEEVDWDYSMHKDYIPPTYTYGHYSDAPFKQRPRSYVRAQRVQVTSAATRHAHSRNEELRRIKSAGTLRSSKSDGALLKSRSRPNTSQSRLNTSQSRLNTSQSRPTTSQSNKEPQRPTTNEVSFRPVTADVAPSESSIVVETKPGRRMSWGFDPVPKGDEHQDLADVKALWRAQIRTPGPMCNDTNPSRERPKRPNSSPPKVDPRLRTPIYEIHSELNPQKHDLDFPQTNDMDRRPLSRSSSRGGSNDTKAKFESQFKVTSTRPRIAPRATPLMIPSEKAAKLPPKGYVVGRGGALSSAASPFKDPLRLERLFRLRTHDQETGKG